jgi:hypothetical protein
MEKKKNVASKSIEKTSRGKSSGKDNNKRPKEDKEKKEKSGPKKAPSGYLLFGADFRDKHKNDKNKVSMKDIGDAWKICSEDEKKKWNDIAEKKKGELLQEEDNKAEKENKKENKKSNPKVNPNSGAAGKNKNDKKEKEKEKDKKKKESKGKKKKEESDDDDDDMEDDD